MRLSGEIDSLTASQHSCIAMWQLRALGAAPNEIMRLRQSPSWRALSRRVLVRSGTPATERQRACAAVLEAGEQGALAATSGAALWQLGTRYRILPACVMADRQAATFPGDVGHIFQRRGIPSRWIVIYDGIRVVRPELCIYQLCGLVHPLAAERALDTALSTRLVSVQSMRLCLDELARRGRNGTVVLRTLLNARPIGFTPVASGLEARFEQVVGPGWRRQVDSGGETWAGRVDFRHRSRPLVVEILSERYHGSLSSQRDDELRRRKLEAAGFTVVEIWDHQLWHAPEEVRATVNTAAREPSRRVS